MPTLTEKVISDKIVLKEEYDSIKDDRDQYAERYETQRQKVRELSLDFDSLTETNKSLTTQIADQASSINNLERNLQDSRDKVFEQLKDIEEMQLSNLLSEAEKNSLISDIEKISSQYDAEKEKFKNQDQKFTELNQQINLQKIRYDALANELKKTSRDSDRNCQRLLNDLEICNRNHTLVSLQKERLKNPKTKILKQINGEKTILEYFEENGEADYFDVLGNRLIYQEEIVRIFKENEFTEEYDEPQLSSAVNQFLDKKKQGLTCFF